MDYYLMDLSVLLRAVLDGVATQQLLLLRSRAVKDTAKKNGPERIRTADLLVANEALYQLSYRPKKCEAIFWSAALCGGPI